jgi:hypothetical protein
MNFKLLRSFTMAGVLSLFFVNAFAQSSKILIHYSAPRIVNFTDRAQYQLAHPVKKSHRTIEQGEDKDKNYKFKPKPVTRDAVSFNIKMPADYFSQLKTAFDSTPEPSNVFNGIQDAEVTIPPDINGAAGNNYLMETTNQEFDIFKKSGGGAVDVVSPDDFFSFPGGDFYDPHVLYDASYGRYIVCADSSVNDGHNALYLGISQTDDPTGNWYVYSVNAIEGATDFLDYPLLGYNSKWIVLTGNDFVDDGNQGVIGKIYVFNRDSLFAGLSGTATRFTDLNAFTLCPAATNDTSLADEYLVQDWNGNSGDTGFVELSKISGTAGSPSYEVVKTIGVNQPWNENTIGAAEGGTSHTIEAGDTRIENAVYAKGSLWFTHNAFLPSTGTPKYICADVWQLNPITDSVLQFIRVADPNQQTLYYYPSVNIDSTGDVMLGYSTSSANLFASAGYAYRAATDPPNTIRNGFIFKTGLASYYKTGDGRNRWGDFTYTCADPLNNSFWTFQQFANTGNNWGTVIANVGGAACTDAPVAGTVVSLSDTVCGGTGVALNLNGNSATTAGLHIQWQQSASGTQADWNNIIGANTAQFFSSPLFSPTYFRSIVKCNNSGLADTTSAIKITVHGITSVPGDSFCETGINTLVVNATGAVNWFANQSSSTSISNTDSLTVNIKGDTTFYVSAGISHSYVAGINNNSVGSGTRYSNFAQGLEFTAISNFVLDSLYVYPSSTGVVIINVINPSTLALVGTESFVIPDSEVSKKTVLRLNMNIEGGADYNINASGSTVKNIFRTSAGAAYPYVVPNVVSINRAINGADGYYYFFYNWHVSTGCGATRIPVPVYVDKLIIAGSDTLCAGDTEILSVTNASSVVWQPGNISSDSITISPQSPTTYTVSGIDTRGCALTDSFTVNVKNCALGVKPIAENAEVNVFPNPAMNEVNIEFNAPIHNYTIALFNTLGQKIYETNQTINLQYEIVPVDLSLLSSGVYFINIKSDNQQWMKKIIKE